MSSHFDWVLYKVRKWLWWRKIRSGHLHACQWPHWIFPLLSSPALWLCLVGCQYANLAVNESWVEPKSQNFVKFCLICTRFDLCWVLMSQSLKFQHKQYIQLTCKWLLQRNCTFQLMATCTRVSVVTLHFCQSFLRKVLPLPCRFRVCTFDWR